MLDLYKEYRENFEEIFENSFDYIYLHDKNGKILDVNNIIIKNLGYSKDEILNMKVTDFLVGESKSEIMNEIGRTLRTGVVNQPKIYKIKKKNGDFLFVEANTIPLRRDGNFYAILGIGHDVTASKKREQDLIISEMKYRHLFSHSPFSILLFTSEGNLIEYNGILSQKISEFIGKDIQGKNFIEIASYLQNSQEIIKIFSERMNLLRQGENLTPLEFSITTNNGEIIWLNWQSSRFEINNQTYIQVILQDITERKNVEFRIKRQSEDLSTLNKIISLGNESTSLKEFLHKSYDKVLDSVAFNKGGLYLYDPNTQHNYLVHHKNVHPDFVKKVEDIDLSEGFFKKIFKKNNPYYIRDFSEYMQNSKDFGIYSAVIVPLRSKDEYVGSLNLASSIEQELSQNELDLLIAIGKQMGIIIQKFESERLLLESEEKFRTLFEKADEGIILADAKTEQIVSANPKICEMLGYTLDEIRALHFADLHPNESLHYIDDQFEEEIDEYSIVNDIPMRRKNGDVFYCNVNSSQLEIAGQSFFLGFFSDITHRLEVEQKLKESEKILRDFIHNATDSISIWDSKLNLIEINDIAADPWDSPNQPFKGTHMTELTPQIIETERYEKYLDLIKTGIPISFDNVRIPPNTGERYFNIKSFKVGNGLGIIGTEITERIKFEQELKESEEKFRIIAEQSFMGVVIIQDGKIKYMNKALADISQYSIEEILNWSEKEILKMIHPDDMNYITKRLQANKDDKMSPFSKNSFRIINKTGEVRWLEDYTSRIIYQGRLANLISIIDVTDKKQAEQLIIEENRRLLELEDLRKDIITRVSHELKTPMTSIYGANQILTRLYAEEIGEDAQKYVEIGLRGCLRMKQLIDNLLDISRLDAKKLTLTLQRENIVDLIIDCVEDMNYLAMDRQLKIKLDVPNEVYYNIDRLRFRQVLTNIISNAIKNTPKSGEILINVVDTATDIKIKIKDSGVGITEKEREKLFEKFGKIERYGMDLGVDIEGSGLGLYISKEIVELHGGQILVESEGRNKGTVFLILFTKS